MKTIARTGIACAIAALSLAIAPQALAQKAKATFVHKMSCPPPQFADPRNGGECWSCPAGFGRSFEPVTADRACQKAILVGPFSKATFHNTIQCLPPNFYDPRNGGECWKCPDKTVRTIAPVDSSEACEVPQAPGTLHDTIDPTTVDSGKPKTTGPKPATYSASFRIPETGRAYAPGVNDFQGTARLRIQLEAKAGDAGLPAQTLVVNITCMPKGGSGGGSWLETWKNSSLGPGASRTHEIYVEWAKLRQLCPLLSVPAAATAMAATVQIDNKPVATAEVALQMKK